MSAKHDREVIKPLKRFPGYWASNTGNIYSSRRRKPEAGGGGSVSYIASDLKKMKMPIDDKGYRKVCFSVPGFKPKQYRVHRIVLEAFTEQREDRLCLHFDGNRLNNNLENLRWGNHVDNYADKVRYGNDVMGVKSHFCKLDFDSVLEMRKLHTAGFSSVAIAKKFNIGYAHCREIVTGRKRKTA